MLIAERLVDAADLQAGQRVLDVATGTMPAEYLEVVAVRGRSYFTRR